MIMPKVILIRMQRARDVRLVRRSHEGQQYSPAGSLFASPSGDDWCVYILGHERSFSDNSAFTAASRAQTGSGVGALLYPDRTISANDFSIPIQSSSSYSSTPTTMTNFQLAQLIAMVVDDCSHGSWTASTSFVVEEFRWDWKAHRTHVNRRAGCTIFTNLESFISNSTTITGCKIIALHIAIMLVCEAWERRALLSSRSRWRSSCQVTYIPRLTNPGRRPDASTAARTPRVSAQVSFSSLFLDGSKSVVYSSGSRRTPYGPRASP
ncbi:hypothetical protein G7K_3741-t1 [Saitoella complicata NRRL Y-17804]|uniref:Uncharacterized protein n=1 Tax=Saitoella complicata (strain BCRC 22490 / CBS 7301 / JCM 7358 / NBRC 10748 / NRRL Y-17804) TaxID=698492 RepID=A0A0E9NI93_SAICN|nr:hypothetical protein G7K_3741-t1 [Saitoella complicata NRRL Y-17804]